MTILLDQIANMPAFSPCYPMPPARYRNVCIQFVCFHAAPAAIDRVLPACFEPADSGLCVAIGLKVGWSANYGAFDESLLVVQCRYEGQLGYFAPVVFLNSRGSIPAGREIYGTPKVYAEMDVSMEERVMVTDTHVGGGNAMSIRSTMHRTANPEDLPQLTPSWRLKVIPKEDGSGPEVMQLVDAGMATSDVTLHVCRAGDWAVCFRPVPTYDLSDFAPIEYSGAYYAEMDYTETYGQVVHDFIK